MRLLSVLDSRRVGLGLSRGVAVGRCVGLGQVGRVICVLLRKGSSRVLE